MPIHLISLSEKPEFARPDWVLDPFYGASKKYFTREKFF